MTVFGGLFRNDEKKNTPEENPAFFDDDITLVPEYDFDDDVTIADETAGYQSPDFVITLSVISVHSEGLSVADRPEQ